MVGGVEIIDTQNWKYAGIVSRGRIEINRFQVRAVGWLDTVRSSIALE
jgi:hypothetical protein